MYALYGTATGDILTYQGRPLVHGNQQEMTWLFPLSRVVPVTEADLRARSPLPPLMLKDHPDMAPVRWPLDPKDFR